MLKESPIPWCLYDLLTFRNRGHSGLFVQHYLFNKNGGRIWIIFGLCELCCPPRCQLCFCPLLFYVQHRWPLAFSIWVSRSVVQIMSQALLHIWFCLDTYTKARFGFKHLPSARLLSKGCKK